MSCGNRGRRGGGEKERQEVMKDSLGIGDPWMWLRIKVTRMILRVYYFFLLRWMVVKKYDVGSG